MSRPYISSQDIDALVGNADRDLLDPERYDWKTLNNLGIYNHCMIKTKVSPASGRILSHCMEKVVSFREKTGGIRLCIFKIGVTADLASRFQLYKDQGYTAMWVLDIASTVEHVHMLEAALIYEYHKHVGCKNRKGSGGDGALNRRPPTPPPYFTYVVGGRADQNRWVG